MSDEPHDNLARTLLSDEPQNVEGKPSRRWVYPLWGVALMSVVVAYMAGTLLVWNMPRKGLAKRFHDKTLQVTRARSYFKAAGLTQSWQMFAPNPNRTNVFIRVLIEDHNGEIWDLEQDIYGINRYPYIWYDRMGKVNRRIDGKKSLQRVYGAWACREWEEEHQGQRAHSVSFIKRYTRVPKPEEARKTWGWNSWELPVKQVEQETIRCDSTANAQLSNERRVALGFEPLEDDGFKHVRSRSWFQKRQSDQERLRRQIRRKALRRMQSGGRPVDADPEDPPDAGDEAADESADEFELGEGSL